MSTSPEHLLNVAPCAPISLALPGLTTVPLPGPAPGFVRFYDLVSLAADVVAAPLASVVGVLQPFNWPFTVVLGGAAALGFRVPVLGAGESFDVVNGGANPGRIGGTYCDLPLGPFDIGLTRLELTNVAQDIVPAPSAGRRSLLLSLMALSTAIATEIRAQWYNADTIGHSLETLQNGTLLSRSATTGVNNLAAFQGVPATPALPGAPLQARLSAAVVLTSPRFVGAWWAPPC